MKGLASFDNGKWHSDCNYNAPSRWNMRIWDDDKKAAKKIVIARGVDHISNWLFSPTGGDGVEFDMGKEKLCVL